MSGSPRAARGGGPSASLAGVVCALALTGCAAPAIAPPPALAAASGGAPIWPRAAQRGLTRQGVLTLTPPPSRALGRRAVQGFFDAVLRESVAELAAWLADDAVISSGPGTTPEPITKVWGARFKQLDYATSGRRPYRSDAVGVFTRRELDALARAYQLSPAEGELLAVVDTRVSQRAPGPRHFGRRLEFLLAPAPDGYRIRRMHEDFELP